MSDDFSLKLPHFISLDYSERIAEQFISQVSRLGVLVDGAALGGVDLADGLWVLNDDERVKEDLEVDVGLVLLSIVEVFLHDDVAEAHSSLLLLRVLDILVQLVEGPCQH